MKTLRKQQLDTVMSRFQNPVFGNQDTNQECPFDLSDAGNYVVKLTTLITTDTGKVFEDDIRYVQYPQTTFEEMYYDHQSKNCYAWVGKEIKVLHDPREGKPEPVKIDKRDKNLSSKIQKHLGVQGVGESALPKSF